ncbi:MAG: TIGR02757 family protein [Bacteroidia bacterium]
MNKAELQKLLDEKVIKYNHPSFLENDPLGIPHRFTLKQDIEISGFFAAILAWGNRKSIINNCNKLMRLMEESPYDFITNHSPNELKRFEKFVHRTFNGTDLLFIIEAFKEFYKEHDSLERLFLPKPGEKTVKSGLENFHNSCFNLSYAPLRSKKHIASPFKKSACKRLNMYLRWMVRDDEKGVDFGIWKSIKPSQLICPLDVHVLRVANTLGLLSTEKSNWETAELLTSQLRKFDKNDPVKYDFALFGMGLEGFGK